MKKIILKAVCFIMLVSYTFDTHAMQQISGLMHKGLDKSSLLIHTIHGALKNLSHTAAHKATIKYNNVIQLLRTTPQLVAKATCATKAFPGLAYRTTRTLIQQHPNMFIASGIAVATFGAFLLGRSALAHRAMHNTKQFLAYRLLHSNNKRLIELALRLESKLNINDSFQDGKTALASAAEQGKDDIVELLISKHAVISASDAQHFKPIHYAAKNGHINIFKQLINADEDIDAVTAGGLSPLHLAAEHGHLEMVISLIQHGADDQLQTADNKTALDLATAKGHKNIAKYLEQVKAPTAPHDWHTQILHRAIDQQDVEMAHIALNNGAHMIDTNPDRTPLLRTIVGHTEHVIGPRDEEIAEILVRKGTPLNITDQDGNTPLHRVVMLENINLAKLFLKRGADINAKEPTGLTSLDIALGKHNKPMVDLLTKYGAELTPEQKTEHIAWLNPIEPATATAQATNS